MVWTRTDRDAVSAEGRELGAFASRRIVDNTDDIVAERMPVPIISLSGGSGSVADIALSSLDLSWMPIFIPLVPEAHRLVVHVNCRILSGVGGDASISAAIGLPSGATIRQSAPQSIGSATGIVLTFTLDLREAQQQGRDILPVLIGVQSSPSASINRVVVRGRNRRSIDGDAHGIAAIADEQVNFSVEFEDSTKPGQPITFIGPLQAYSNTAEFDEGPYWIWPQLPLIGPSENIDRMILTRLGSAVIDSIAMEYQRLDTPYYSTRALPMQRRLDSAQTQVASSMPMRTSPEHAMLSTQDYLLGSRPQIYAVGPGTHNRTGMVAQTNATGVSSNEDDNWLWIPIDAPQSARKLDGNPGEIRGFTIVIGCIGVAEQGSDNADVSFKVELIRLATGSTGEPAITVLKSQNYVRSISSTTDVEDYARNVVGFAQTGANNPELVDKHQLTGLYPSWQWYVDRLNFVNLEIEEDDADERPHAIRITAFGASDDINLYTSSYYVTDLAGQVWADKIKDPAP